MTKQEILSYNKEYLTPCQVASIIGCDAQYIREAARLDPPELPFPTLRSGNRTKIPKEAFCRFMGWI